MHIADMKKYLNKVVVFDFLNGVMVMTQITEVNDSTGYVKTKDWVLILQDPRRPDAVNFVPYGAHVPHTQNLKEASIEASKIINVMIPHKPYEEKYLEFISPIKRVSDMDQIPGLDQIDLSKFGKTQLNG